MKQVKTKVVHSRSEAAWVIVDINSSEIAVCPYYTSSHIETMAHWKQEAFERAEFISDCFNHSDQIESFLKNRK